MVKRRPLIAGIFAHAGWILGTYGIAGAELRWWALSVGVLLLVWGVGIGYVLYMEAREGRA